MAMMRGDVRLSSEVLTSEAPYAKILPVGIQGALGPGSSH